MPNGHAKFRDAKEKFRACPNAAHVYSWTYRDGTRRNAWKTRPCGGGVSLKLTRILRDLGAAKPTQRTLTNLKKSTEINTVKQTK